MLRRLCSVYITSSPEVAAIHFEGADGPFRRAKDKNSTLEMKNSGSLTPTTRKPCGK